LKTFLKQYPTLLLEVRQKGLMMGLQYTNESIGPRMTKKLADRGVIAIYTGNDPSICRLMPPLVITPEEVDFVLNALADSMKELSGGSGPRQKRLTHSSGGKTWQQVRKFSKR